ncbi:MAG TPA: ABC transporter ATP-binding protein [Smithellaceae bacterium]|nr:ABC transporter ATP-binding protein [Smithellaceae bacterium]
MLEVQNLVVKYGAVQAVKGNSFAVREGEIVSILGANGAGKSSTLFGVAGMIDTRGKLFSKDVVEGKIVFQGQDISDYSNSKRVKMGLILCPEGRRNFPELTIKENLKMGAYCRGDFNKKIDFVYSLFPRLKERQIQLANSLSGGEQQMLAIGRSLMSDPVMLMLDEPSLGLSPVLIDEVFAVLVKLKEKGIPILLVEQNAIRSLKISDRAYILETGKIVHEDKAQTILNDEKLKKAYLGL